MAMWNRRLRLAFVLPGLLLAACTATADRAPNATYGAARPDPPRWASGDDGVNHDEV
jgi:outer membrane biogenesis lipoprotein LolB